ncbi:MAG TPA: type I-E CRISPR-associated protein Cse1/CasA, partial [Rugosimonospora sp.]|nr:type I-E CRISPR-associated protein Cse1/CasA [Rugosimonospora sp.]
MKFSLIDEPWILAQRVNGEVTQVSLLDLVRYAHELRAIVGQPATQEFAILRLVLAVLHAATRGPTTDSWSDMWRCDRLPVDAVGAYLDRYRERFDLLHPRAPFYQVAGLQTAKDEVFGLERLIADVPTGPRLFTGRSGEALRQISFGEAARWLVHAQAFDVSGIKSGAVGDSRVKKGKGYPIGTGFAGSLGGVFADGDTVRETLL